MRPWNCFKRTIICINQCAGRCAAVITWITRRHFESKSTREIQHQTRAEYQSTREIHQSRAPERYTRAEYQSTREIQHQSTSRGEDAALVHQCTALHCTAVVVVVKVHGDGWFKPSIASDCQRVRPICTSRQRLYYLHYLNYLHYLQFLYYLHYLHRQAEFNQQYDAQPYWH